MRKRHCSFKQFTQNTADKKSLQPKAYLKAALNHHSGNTVGVSLHFNEDNALLQRHEVINVLQHL